MEQRLIPDPELEELVRDLNASAPATRGRPETGSREAAPAPAGPRHLLPEPTAEDHGWLSQLLFQGREARASDLLLVAGAAPTVRIDGALRALAEHRLSAGATARLCSALLPDSRRVEAESTGTADFSFERPGLGRFRCNVHRERGRWAAAVRLFPAEAPSLEALGLPLQLGRLARLRTGLILVTGPAGSGKTTTLAALTREILATRRVHLITIEDPVEFEHPQGRSLVEHVEVGRDTPSFAAALRSALRQDPDTLVIGEMRDPQSVRIALSASETGHLVLSTLHTGDAPQTVHRILDSLPEDEAGLVRSQLSISLAAVISQQLVPRRDDRGRVPAVEVLVATPAVRHLIRQGKIAQLRSQIALERGAGMVDLDDSLAKLVRRGLVSVDEALARARAPEELARTLQDGRQESPTS